MLQNMMHIRSELERVTEDMADYVNSCLLRQIINYGYKGSKKMLSAHIMTKPLADTKSVPYLNVNMRAKLT